MENKLVQRELIFFKSQETSFKELFAELSEVLVQKGYVRDSWLDAIVEREEKYPTGLAFDGIKIAIPHTDSCHVIKPYIAVVKLNRPVLFEFMAGVGDTVEAQMVFNLGIMHQENQVQMLQKLMTLCADANAVSELMGAHTEDELYRVVAKQLEE